jgi:GH24 family phage-related lysozyme (muramidase)
LVWTQQQAEAQLAYDMVKYANQVTHALSGALTNQHQFDALVSFQYNTGSLASSTLLKKHKAGDYAGAALEFGKWVRAGGHVLQGLVRRRAAEAALYKSV